MKKLLSCALSLFVLFSANASNNVKTDLKTVNPLSKDVISLPSSIELKKHGREPIVYTYFFILFTDGCYHLVREASWGGMVWYDFMNESNYVGTTVQCTVDHFEDMC